MAYFMLKSPGDTEAVRYDVPQTLTYGEQVDILKELGQEAAGLGVIWVTVRRRFPKTTIDDLRNAEVVMVEEEDEELPPTSAAGNGSSPANEPSSTTLGAIGSHGSESSTE